LRHLSDYFKGMAMGAADVVPGVSGGTIAFITGILYPLLDGIRKINPQLLVILKEKGLKAAFLYINGWFLIAVFAGILTSILSLAKLISWLLANYPIPVWSFFFGLILFSVIHMLKQIKAFNLARLILFAVGVVFAWVITTLHPIAMEVSYLNFFIAGCIAICAMILPGISGSFILLLLGLYPAVLAAVKGLDIGILACFAIGCVVGLLSFSHVLSALLRHFHDETVMFLTGLMLGTLGKIWPWKEVLTWRTNSQGEQVALTERNLSPMQFEQVTGQSSEIIYAIICLLLGITLVWGLEQFGKKHLNKTA
jgi:putative membrane protein